MHLDRLSSPLPLPATGCCELWTVELARGPEGGTDAALPRLPVEEREAAAGLRLPDARRRHVLARAALRSILAAYLGQAPAALRIEAGGRGKPALAPSQPLRFNLSHCGDHMLLALALDREIGVDLELQRPLRDLDALAARILAPGEHAQLDASPRDSRVATLLRFWTCKEALAKAHGHGIGLDLRSLCVELAPRSGARVVALPAGWGLPGEWSLQSIPAPQGGSAMLAARGAALAVTQRTLAW